MQFKQNKIKKQYIVLIFMILIALISYGFISKITASQLYQGVKIEKIDVKAKKIKHSTSNIYDDAYQKEAQVQIKSLKKEKNFNESTPLVVYNPYGTNTGAVYYYAKTTKKAYVKCTIEAVGTKKYKYTLKNNGSNELTTNHEYQITGLAVGKRNKVSLVYYDENNKVIAYTYFYIKVQADSDIPEITSKNIGTSKQKMSNGLFAILGHDKKENANIYLYDNYGVSRGKMPLNSYRADRIMMIGNQIAYSYEDNKIAFVNRLGKVTKTISVKGYEFHHDYVYDSKNKKIIALVNDLSKDTIEDVVISIDITTGTVKKLIDFEDYLSDMRENAVSPEGGNTYGGDELDWLHLNSLSITADGSVVFSSREQSSIIKVEGIYNSPKIKYMIHSGSVYEGTDYEAYLLKQTGTTFTGQAGQHTITYEYDASLKKGQYYLYMYNNNYGVARTIPTFDWSLYTGTDLGEAYNKGTKSMYYKYLVDENKGTYQLVQSFDLPYSGIVSSVQNLENTIAFSSGTSKIYGEYDTSGKLIKSFTYEATDYAYRVMKYSFEGFWYK